MIPLQAQTPCLGLIDHLHFQTLLNAKSLGKYLKSAQILHILWANETFIGLLAKLLN